MNTTRVYSYFRVSTDSQSADRGGSGIERQYDLARSYAEKNNYIFDEELSLVDIGKSAFTSKHRKGNLGIFLDEIRHGNVPVGSILIIEQLDRLSREHPLKAFKLIIELLESGIRLITAHDNQEYTWDSTQTNSGQLHMLSAQINLANNFSVNLSRRIKSGKQLHRKSNIDNRKPITKMCPAWIKVENGEYVLINDRVIVVQRIMQELANGIGAPKLANRLNIEGIPAFDRAGQGMNSNKKSNGWHHSYINKISTNIATIGLFQPTMTVSGNWKREKIGNPVSLFPPIISKELFDKVNSRIKKPGRRGEHFRNILTGIPVCSHCKSKMIFKSKGRKIGNSNDFTGNYLVCDSAYRRLTINGNRVCERTEYFQYDILENYMVKLCSSFATHYLKPVAKEINVNMPLMMQQISEKEHQLENLMKSFGNNPSSNIMTVIKNIDDELSKLRSELKKIEGNKSTESKIDFREFIKLSENRTYENRAHMHSILTKLIDYLEVDVLGRSFDVFIGGGAIYSEYASNIIWFIDRQKCKDTKGNTFETPNELLEIHNRIRSKKQFFKLVVI